ncbi:hypothetical protein Y032_0048g1705 [Ancylostoma ceylanicum]|uniref:Uncharacterized protein n=1 Tax=Ancylostoma ceylanicum TaxID=53326 RepID=A0A016UBF2_9BILA|nr:hypothetical protein Y032_0048g1705 [Ancylostoma ceylanicum]
MTPLPPQLHFAHALPFPLPKREQEDFSPSLQIPVICEVEGDLQVFPVRLLECVASTKFWNSWTHQHAKLQSFGSCASPQDASCPESTYHQVTGASLPSTKILRAPRTERMLWGHVSKS